MQNARRSVPNWVQRPLWRIARSFPAVDLDFSAGVADQVTGRPVTVSRSGSRSFWNGSSYASVASNLPGVAVDVRSGAKGLIVENASTNQIRNNSNTGAVAGTPGTLPTNWYTGNTGTLSRQIVGVGTVLGIPYIDIRYFGTSSTTSFNISAESNTQIVAASGETWTMSFWLALLPGGGASPDKYEMLITERQSGGTAVKTQLSGGMLLPSAISIGQRFEHTVTLDGGASTARINPNLQCRIQTATAYDFTIRIAGWQIERRPRATSFIPTTNAAVTREQDVVSLTGVTLPPSGTMVVQYRPAVTGAAAVVASLNNGSADDSIEAGHGATGVATAEVRATAVTQASLTKTSSQFPGLRTAILRYGTNDVAFASDDATAEVDNVATMPPLDRLSIGSVLGGSSVDAIIERVTVFPAALSNSLMASLPPRRTLNLFLVAGQSNANGTGNIGGSAPHYLTKSVVPDVFAWNGTLIRQFDHATSGSTGDGRNWVSGTSSFFSFAAVALREIAYSMENVCTCWVTAGGSALNIGAAASGCWNSNYGAIPGGTPRLAEDLQNRFQSLAAHCAINNIVLNVRGLIWHQGESDSSAEAQAAYQANFEALIASIRAYTGRSTLPVLYGTTASGGPAGVRTAHLAVADADPNAFCRDNNDLGTSDGTHFNDAGIATFGRWVASTYLSNYGAT